MKEKKDVIILGGGLSGLASGFVLANAGFDTCVYERDNTVGGLSKTIERNGFRFDLGGHRFFTHDEAIDRFVRDLMGKELIEVHRSSKILLRNRYFNYPLKPMNAMFGLGIATTIRILADYARERLTPPAGEAVSLEDWVVRNFGRTMFNIYFKQYSEKVWGIDCSRISATWVAQRIKGLSLAQAIKNAFFRFSGRGLATLTDTFSYPALGIGRLSDRLREEIEKNGAVRTGVAVVRVNHSDFRVESIDVKTDAGIRRVRAEEFLSSIPVTKLVGLLNPAPPAHIVESAARLRFRDLVVAAIMVDRPRVTDQTWIYLPEQKIPFGRIHEPTNWSPAMAPEGKTLLVVEYFSFRGDTAWNMTDADLEALTIENLGRLGFISPHEVLDSMIVRVPNAYPLFEVGYRKHAEELLAYLDGFANLRTTGRSGMFRYYNMDVAIKSGIESADWVIRKSRAPEPAVREELVFAGS